MSLAGFGPGAFPSTCCFVPKKKSPNCQSVRRKWGNFCLVLYVSCISRSGGRGKAERNEVTIKNKEERLTFFLYMFAEIGQQFSS